MKEYIEKQQAIDAAREDGKKIPTLAIRIMHDIKSIPAADVVPVVRCKDCKHHWTYKCMDGMPIEECDLEQTFYDANIDYCSLAERREVTE